MPSILTFSSLSSRAFGHIGGKSRRLTTQTFTSNGTWVAPAGVTLVSSVVGEGSDGTAAYVDNHNYGVVNVSFRTDTSTGSGNVTWDNFAGLAEGIAADLNADGNATWTFTILYVWPDGTNAYAFTDSITVTAGATLVPGSATPVFSSGWHSSGVIANSGTADMHWETNEPAAAGNDSTALGFTFPGGAAGMPASPGTYTNVSVTPGASYPIVVPTGGSVTINYYV